ncbi:MAG TPA: hypothetical protein VN823_15860, partial [Stellaceae bacterium]|nr:hypothetical protein [Stellaceae bacterium]
TIGADRDPSKDQEKFSKFRTFIVALGGVNVRRVFTLIRRRRPAAATVIEALKVAETHEFCFEPPEFMAEHENLQRMACARSDEEGEPII